MIVNKEDVVKRIIDNRLFSVVIADEQYACLAPHDIHDDNWIDLTKVILISNQEKEIFNKVYAPINY
jgi:hypothetical protein